MRRLLPALVLGAMIFGAAPANAEMGPDYDVRLDVQYMPLHVSTSKPSGVVEANMPVIRLSAEGRVFKGFVLGGNYAFGDGNHLNISGTSQTTGLPETYECTDATYRDYNIYVKIPFNYSAFGEAERVMGPRPCFSPFYGYIGYKDTQLRATPPTSKVLSGKMNVEKASGFGIGIGADLALDPVGVYGQFVYYPSMKTHNIGGDVEHPDGKLHVLEWDAGIRTNFEESPIQARIGYHYEQHKGKNLTLKYDGVQFAATAEF